MVGVVDKVIEGVQGVINIKMDGQTPEFKKYLREIMGLNKSLRTIRGALKTATAKYVMVKGHLDMEYEKQKELIGGEGGELSDEYMELRKRVEDRI